MDQLRRNEITRFADAVRDYIGLAAPPFDMDEAVRRLDGALIELDRATAAQLGEASVRKVGESFEVHLGPVAPTRRRFNIAHELGHLFLHMGFRVDAEKWQSYPEYERINRLGSSEQEFEAHEFAGALLMPEAAFRAAALCHRNDGTFHTAEIAAHFGVSVQAATTRGRWLGLFSWT